jgi:lysophospholipase L1-like esterase
MKYSRRTFLRQFGSAAGLFFAVRSGLAQRISLFSADPSAFEMLAIGDSLIWGQGLKEEDKSYSLVKKWLETEVFAGNRRVNLKVKAHSGASLTLRDEEAAALVKLKKDPHEYLFREIPASFPSIQAQIDSARKEYENPHAVNLILLTGSITDVLVSEVLNIFNNEKKFRAAIPKFCYESMFRLLKHAAAAFPNALILVAGYYPIVSSKSSTRKLFNAIFELYNYPRPLKPVLNNVLTRPFLKILHKKVTKRSRVWFEESNSELQKAVKQLNGENGRQRAIFVKTPFTEENSYAANNTLVWELQKKGRLEDAYFEERLALCKKQLAPFINSRLKYSARFCELGAIAHPNVEGAKAFAEAIQNNLKPFLSTEIK